MFKKILEHAIHIISHDHKLVRFSFFISFSHSIFVLTMILYGINNIINAKYGKGISSSEIFSFIQHDFTILIVVAVIGIIGYEFIYPIGQASIINYLDSGQKSINKSIGKGIEKFFVMFEFNNILRLFSLITFITTLLRLAYLEILDSVFVLILMSIRGICVLSATFIRPYTKYAINIEGLGLSDAIKRSSKLTLQNIGITIKFVILEFFLMFRFIFSSLIILGIPLLIVYFASNLNIIDKQFIQITIYATIIGLVLITTYINGIIEAFFATYRYKVYKHIVDQENE